ncbi:CoA-transferase [Chitinasiproducens palmae]|uniref:Acetate CoA-transferase YdiF n=1 Tax=Chitinasiproducens palmae TaxID=1770053 RepID=A0A1H2PPR7_9BURK|nr:CoA-transferase [Chitinasiproducens palmae]SDV48787.1 propionate CoA-transferase [Chitinasiproducens palmae]
MSKIVTAEQAVASIRDGQTVASVGVIGWVVPDATLSALGRRFEQTGAPRNLTFYFPCGTGDAVGIKGMDHVAKEGLMKRIVSGSYINPVDPRTGERPALMRLIQENRIEAYSWPIGASMHWLREVARRSPGYVTRVGVGTYADPKHGGGKFTARCEDDLIQRLQLGDETCLFYPTWPLDVAIIRASSADEFGNLSFEDEPLVSAGLALALAAKASQGRVIAQVRRIVPRGSRPATSVRLPGNFVDAIVVDADMMMTTDVPYDRNYLVPQADRHAFPVLPFGPDKVIARRAAREVRKRELGIFGFGAAADIPLIMAEQGLIDAQTGSEDYWFTTEHGSYGGIVMNGWQFSANLHPTALLDGLQQFDVIDGGLCRFAALAFAEYDARGHVNVSKFGRANPGAGGFTDIAANAERLVFTGSFTTGGLDVDYAGGRATIRREGKVSKFVDTAQSITYAVQDGVRAGQSALIVTERAVFEVGSEGLVLSEVAPGIDVRRDVLGQMGFAPARILDPLPLMDARLFEPHEASAAAALADGDPSVVS